MMSPGRATPEHLRFDVESMVAALSNDGHPEKRVNNCLLM